MTELGIDGKGLRFQQGMVPQNDGKGMQAWSHYSKIMHICPKIRVVHRDSWAKCPVVPSVCREGARRVLGQKERRKGQPGMFKHFSVLQGHIAPQLIHSDRKSAKSEARACTR